MKYYQEHGEASITLEEIEEETAKDDVLQEIMKCVSNKGWNNLNYDLRTDYQSFKNIRDELSVVKGLLLRDERIIIPESLRERAVKLAHASHQGIVRTKGLIRETIWFPGIDKMVEQRVSECLPCQSCTPGGTENEPAQMTKLPDEAWQEVSMDFSGPYPGGEYLLVVMDDYSRFPELEIVYSTSANATIPALDAMFARQGIPVVAKSDNGPPFNSEQFADWARYINFHHRKITPRWPEANGEVERFMRTLNKAVRIAKLEKGSWKQEIYKFLRHYRATPHSTTGKSPSEMLNARKLRTELPSRVRKKKVRFKDQVELAERRDERLKSYIKELADDRKNAKPSTISIGDDVLVKQDKTNKLSTPFDSSPYKVINKKGSMVTAGRSDKTITRNASHFKKISKQLGKGFKNTSQEPEFEFEARFDLNEPDISHSDIQPTFPTGSTPVTPKTPVPIREPVRGHEPVSDRPQRSHVAKKLPGKYDGFAMS